jgi:hypothetical protein
VSLAERSTNGRFRNGFLWVQPAVVWSQQYLHARETKAVDVKWHSTEAMY